MNFVQEQLKTDSYKFSANYQRRSKSYVKKQR